MRIRKNARLISSPSSSSFLVCQLNRSPWDVDSFSLQADWEDGFGVSGSLAEAVPSSDSFPSGESMELSFEYVEKSLPLLPAPPPPPMRLKTQEGENVGEEIQIGGGNDKRNGWQHIHHQLKPPPLKVGPPLPPIPTAPKKRGRPKKPTTAATTTTSTTPTTPVASNNPYEFYYYSGFGPKWSKRRGGSKYIGGGGNDNKNADESPGSSSTTSHIMSEDDKDDDDNKKNNCNTTISTSKVFVMESKVNDELDYIEDDFDDFDDDDNEDEDANSGGRRVRKPVKARSLKSLM